MDWKKILIASFIPMASLFLISLIGELLYSSLPGRVQQAHATNFLLWSWGSVLLMFIYTGYAAIRSNLKESELIVSGILAVFFFSVIAQAAMAIIFKCDLSRDFFRCLDVEFLAFYILNPAAIFWFLGICGLTLGWSLALTIQKIKSKEKLVKKKSKQT